MDAKAVRSIYLQYLTKVSTPLTTCIAVNIYCPLKITQHTAIVKKDDNKTEYTLSDYSYTSFNHAKPHVLFIMIMFCLLDRTIQICVSYLVLEQFKCGSLSTIRFNSLMLTTGCSTWHLVAKNSLRI